MRPWSIAGLLAILIPAAVAVYGFWISLAGQPLFRDEVAHAGA